MKIPLPNLIYNLTQSKSLPLARPVNSVSRMPGIYELFYSTTGQTRTITNNSSPVHLNEAFSIQSTDSDQQVLFILLILFNVVI